MLRDSPDKQLEVAIVASSETQGVGAAEDNEVVVLSLKVVPQVLGLNVVGRRRDKLSDGPIENPKVRRRLCQCSHRRQGQKTGFRQ